MYAFDRRNFVEVLEQLETGSKLEEMLLLLTADQAVAGFKMQDNQLYEQKVVNNDLKDGKRYPNWELSQEQSDEFFEQLEAVIEFSDLTKMKAVNIAFKDFGVRVELKSRNYQNHALVAYRRLPAPVKR